MRRLIIYPPLLTPSKLDARFLAENTTQQQSMFLKQHTNVLLTEKGRLVRAGIILAHCWWSRIIFSYVDQGEYFLRVGSLAAEVSYIYNNIKFILVLCGRITHPKSLEKHRNLLQKYGQALMAMAGEGKLDWLSQRIMQGDVPQALMNRKLISMDMGALIAGKSEDGLEAVLKEPMLRYGELQCIGATTLDAHSVYFEKDPTLEHCFQQVYANQPTEEDTVIILRGLRERYELHPGARISDSALVEAAILLSFCVFVAIAAIDVVDEAAGKLKMEITSKPTALDEINRSVLQLEMERLSLTSITDKASKDRLNLLEAELALLKKKQAELIEQWEHEKSLMYNMQSIRKNKWTGIPLSKLKQSKTPTFGGRGHEDGGQLTEKVRMRPYAVVLFDETEKAHPNVFNVFLQILDDGRLTDSHGHRVSFTKTIIIMTSNVGSQHILDTEDCFMPKEIDLEIIKQRVKAAARSIFRPEFINRIDEYILFRPLDRSQINIIAQ
ncbi:casein lytic proteinase B3 [Artemisia annua]|uniref:Casein lytic proteinase B3 n=1 Tax=Artemisia annua TaxID=35608 RepID=A0A2U1L4N9_ARTAN|nr:casein lytic proteinase B3 [Artemisia annua]